MRLLAVLQTDCPTCQLIVPYLNRLVAGGAPLSGLSQDPASATDAFARQLEIAFPLELDLRFKRSIELGVATVPTLFLFDDEGRIARQEPGFDKTVLNELAGVFGVAPVASLHDGAPAMKPGCSSRHLEPQNADAAAPALDVHGLRGPAASRLSMADSEDPHEFCFRTFGDGLPVVPPTEDRVRRMLDAIAMDMHEVVARVPPCFGPATVEKIAANAVMAGCVPEMMSVLVPLTRAVCDERFNAHGLQATTHFAAPLIIINGPVRKELGFHSGQNLFSNVSRSNSTLGRALQLILLQIGGARPTAIDMSALGNPGKFGFCIAESEEDNPWDPLHVEAGFSKDQSAVSLFGGEAPHGVSDHKARTARGVLKTISYSLATVWSYRVCMMPEALLVLCPEHVQTIRRDGWSKQDVRQFLFENTGVPHRCFEVPDGEGIALRDSYTTVMIDGEPCYRKFRAPEQIKIVVAGGRAGKFSAIVGSWQTGPRGSQMVTYPI
jgi:hypothetical protein